MLFKNMCHNRAVFIMYVVLLRTNRMKYAFDCFFICIHFSELYSPEWAPNVIDACELVMGLATPCDARKRLLTISISTLETRFHELPRTE